MAKNTPSGYASAINWKCTDPYDTAELTMSFYPHWDITPCYIVSRLLHLDENGEIVKRVTNIPITARDHLAGEALFDRFCKMAELLVISGKLGKKLVIVCDSTYLYLCLLGFVPLLSEHQMVARKRALRKISKVTEDVTIVWGNGEEKRKFKEYIEEAKKDAMPAPSLEATGILYEEFMAEQRAIRVTAGLWEPKRNMPTYANNK